MYSLAAFGEMIADRVRMNAYEEALRRTAPGKVVLDLGAGTGILSLLACRHGARRVYAVEPSSAVQVLREAAQDNGFAERIVVLQARSTEVALPEQADVIVSDLRGVLPPFQRNLRDLADVRGRLLAPGGRMVPETDTIFVAVVSAAEAVERQREVWSSRPFGLDLGSTMRFIEHIWTKHRAAPEELLCEPTPWISLDYRSRADARLAGRVVCTITAPKLAHGLLAWFDTELTGGVGFSNRPGAPSAIYGQALFPWPRPVSLRAGDQVEIELRADPVGGEYIWTWTTEIRSAGDAPATERFRQSSFLAAPLSLQTLRRRDAECRPTLSPDGQLSLRALTRMAQGSSLAELASELHGEHADRFATLEDALEFVADLSERYAR